MDADVDLTNQLRKLEGYLSKRGSDTKFVGEPKWQRRYFVLQGEELSYKKRKEDKEFSRVIKMADVKLVDISDNPSKKREISLATLERIYMLRCSEEDESDEVVLDRWFSNIATNQKILEGKIQPKDKGLSASSSTTTTPLRVSNPVTPKNKERDEEKSSTLLKDRDKEKEREKDKDQNKDKDREKDRDKEKDKEKMSRRTKLKGESASTLPVDTNLPLPNFIKDSIKHIKVTSMDTQARDETYSQHTKFPEKTREKVHHWEKYHADTENVKSVEIPADFMQTIRVGWARRLLKIDGSQSTLWREVCLVPMGGGTLYFCHSLQKAQVIDFVSVGCITEVRIITSLRDVEHPICGQYCFDAVDLLPTLHRDIQSGPASDCQGLGGVMCEIVVASMPLCERLSSIVLLFREAGEADEWVQALQKMKSDLPEFCRVTLNPFQSLRRAMPLADTSHLSASCRKLGKVQTPGPTGAPLFLRSVLFLISAIIGTLFLGRLRD